MGAPCTGGGLCILCVLLCVPGAQGSAAMDSLNCTTDYRTHWRCEWRERADTHRVLPLSLYHWDSVEKATSRCVPLEKQHDRAQDLLLSCRVNVSGFISNMRDSFTLLPQRNVELNAEITPAHKVQTPPPQGLRIHKSGDGQLTLSWRTPIHTDSLVLVYQISYRRMKWEEWEDAPPPHVSTKSKITLDPQLLIPGSTYRFKVRAKIQESQHCKGLWSSWSEELAWNMPEDDGVSPQNLQCVYDGVEQMKCSWEVRAMVTQAVSYTLYYSEAFKDSSSGEISVKGGNMCDPMEHRAKAGVSYVLYSCTLQVPPALAHNSLLVQVRPLEEVKTFIPCLNIQVQPPHNLRAEERPERGYMLKWNPKEIGANIPLTYQLCYWKEGDPGCPDHLLLNVSGILTEYYIPSSELQGSTKYVAQVRSKPKIQPNNCNSGPWSNWSSRTTWKTKKAVYEWSLYIIVPISVLFLLVFLYLGYKFIKRSKKKWEDSLPNPSKSKLLNKIHLGFRALSPPTNTSEAALSICFEERPEDALQVTEAEREETVEQRPQTPNECPLGPYSIAPPAEEKTSDHESRQDMPSIDGPPDPTDATISSDLEPPSNAFHNGPYQMYTRTTSLSSLGGKQIKDPGYFTLPRCQAELWRLHEKQLLPTQENVPSRNDMGYVSSMGGQPAAEPPNAEPPNAEPHAQDSRYITVPSASELQKANTSPVMLVTPDGAGPFMLKQVGDYCFFPGHCGSQERLEVKVEAPTGQKDPQLLPDPPLPAVQAFKFMQGGYLALPETQGLSSLVKLVEGTCKEPQP